MEGLHLEQAGVEYTLKGIKTTGTLQTTAPNIYACGDVTGPYRFSHMAEYQAKIATQNAIFLFKRRVDYRNAAKLCYIERLQNNPFLKLLRKIL